MKILFLTYYFEPDLSACSFRNTSLLKELSSQLNSSDTIEVITTHPNRYDSYRCDNQHNNINDNVIINKIDVPNHGGGIIGQIKSFKLFYFQTLKIINNKNYDLVYASSSKFFTAFLGARVARKKNAKLYLDIRDIFRETVLDIYKNPIIRLGLNIVLKPLEKYTFNSANHINLVSKGFKSYFNYKTNYTFYTNGIDSVFLEKDKVTKTKNNKTIVYAGNIGEGQGLHLIIPQIASKLKAYTFKIIGDGGCKKKLAAVLKENKITNVLLLDPINRIKLLEEYGQADFLFLHLNKHKAFERVLPSKLFEYGTFNVPIIAGVAGYAAEFLKKNISNVIIFKPLDSEQLVKQLNNYEYKKEERKEFQQKFSRNTINVKMAKSILKTIN